MKSGFLSQLSMLAAVLMAALVSSCTDFDFDSARQSTKEQQFTANFLERYGSIDPINDFNTAESNTARVTIHYSGTFTLQIFTAHPFDAADKAFCVARYRGLEGDGQSYELNVDAPSMLSTLYVALTDEENGTVVKEVSVVDAAIVVTFGASDAVGTRAFSVEASSRYWSITGSSKTFSKDYLDAVLSHMPEGVGTTDNNDYELVSNGPFTIYPIYSQTSGQDELGFYYYNPKTEKATDAHIVTVIPDIQNSTLYPKGSSYWTKSTMNDPAYQTIDMKGLTIDVPKGYRVGMYLKNRTYGESGYISQTENLQAANTFFSSQALNLGESYSAYYKSPSFFLLGLEDWKLAAGGDNDCNDFVFSVIAQSEELIPDIVRLDSIVSVRIDTITEHWEETVDMSYLIAFEDLGSTDDSDFNDVVLRVQHASGEEDATVWIEAAGGTLETYVKYGDQYLWGGKEVHDLYGVPQSTMVNTGWASANNPSPTKVRVGSDFKIKNGAKNFHIEVTQHDGVTRNDVAVPLVTGVVPQAILVADPNWKWPNERVHIGDKYSGFYTFVSNYKAGSSWYNVTWTGKGSATTELGEEGTYVYDTTYTVSISSTAYVAIDEGGLHDQTASLVNGANGLMAYRNGDQSGTVYTFQYTVPSGYEVIWARLEVTQSQAGQILLTSENNSGINSYMQNGKVDKNLEQELRAYNTSGGGDYFTLLNGSFTITTSLPKILQNVVLNVKLKKINGTYPGTGQTIYEGDNDLTEYRKAVTLADGKTGYQFKYSPKPGFQIESADIVVEFEKGTPNTEKDFYKRDSYTGDPAQRIWGTSTTLAWNSADFKNGFTLGLPYLDQITNIKSVKLTNVTFKDMRRQWSIDFASEAAEGHGREALSTFSSNGYTYNTYKWNGIAYANLGLQDDAWYYHTGGLYTYSTGNRRLACNKVYAGQYIYIQTDVADGITWEHCELSKETKFSDGQLSVYRIVSCENETVTFSVPRTKHIYYFGVFNEIYGN